MLIELLLFCVSVPSCHLPICCELPEKVSPRVIRSRLSDFVCCIYNWAHFHGMCFKQGELYVDTVGR